MTGPPVRLRAGGSSHLGPRRMNQDAAFTADWAAAVADGVGGGPAGDLASAALVHRLAAGRLNDLGAEQLAVVVRLANWDLRAYVERDPSLNGMSTTFTGLFVGRDGRLLLAHAGDSRAYRLRASELNQQTRDDSFVQGLIDQGLVSEEDALSHPRRNLITASLSGAERDVATVAEHDAVLGDRWLLCSDGLTDYVGEAVISAALLQHVDPADAAQACVDLALKAGTRDNVTAVVCDVVDADADTYDSLRPTFFGAAAERFMEELDDLDELDALEPV